MSARLKRVTEALWGTKQAGEDAGDHASTTGPAGFLVGSWSDFEAWIRSTIGGDFIWKVRPRDSAKNRQMVADSIIEAVSNNGGSFPERNAFLERIER